MSLPCGPRTEPEPLCRAVAWVVRKLRERRDWSLGQLARVAGLRRQTIGYVESLQRVPTLDTLVRISHALGRELHALLKLAGRALLRWSRWGGPGWQQ